MASNTEPYREIATCERVLATAFLCTVFALCAAGCQVGPELSNKLLTGLSTADVGGNVESVSKISNIKVPPRLPFEDVDNSQSVIGEVSARRGDHNRAGLESLTRDDDQGTREFSTDSNLAPVELHPAENLSAKTGVARQESTHQLPWNSDFPEQIVGIAQLPREAWPLSVDEAIQLAFKDRTVLRSLGAQILNNPESIPSAHQPWILSSDPRAGVDAALADFDATVNGQVNYANNDDVFNSAVLGGGANVIQQDLVNTSLTWQKFTSTGAQYSVVGAIDYDDNTRPSNLFPSVYNTRLEAQVRQPLFQGRGQLFNSIAGPNSRVDRQGGTGILIAQANVDASVVQFERNVTAFVNDIVSAYWALYLSYQNVEIARESFEQADRTWQASRARRKSGLAGGEAYSEALAREQRDRLEVQLLEAIHNTGQTGAVGLLQADAQLRLLLNLPADGQTLLFPVEEPIGSATVFDGESLKRSAIAKRVEVREQNIRVKTDELQLLAANNFLLPRLDAVATYRNNGFGDTLAGGNTTGLGNALGVAADGLFDEWEIGLQYNVVLGARRAKAGVRNSRLRLRRSRELLREVQKRIHFEVETALRSAARSELTLAATGRLLDAALESYESHQAAFESDLTSIDELLRSQQRLADAQRAFNRQVVDRTLSIEGVFRETGSLLEIHGVKAECENCVN